MVVSLTRYVEAKKRAAEYDAVNIAAHAELMAKRQATSIRLHMPEIQSGRMARLHNVVSYAAFSGRM